MKLIDDTTDEYDMSICYKYNFFNFIYGKSQHEFYSEQFCIYMYKEKNIKYIFF